MKKWEQVCLAEAGAPSPRISSGVRAFDRLCTFLLSRRSHPPKRCAAATINVQRCLPLPLPRSGWPDFGVSGPDNPDSPDIAAPPQAHSLPLPSVVKRQQLALSVFFAASGEPERPAGHGSCKAPGISRR